MTEQEYITATNLTRVRLILPIMHGMMVGDEYGVDQKTYREAYKAVANMVDVLFEKIDLKENDSE